MATRKEMEDAIRKIDLEFGKDPDGDTPLDELDADEIKEIYDEYMDNYASKKKKDTKVKRAKSGGLMKKANGGMVNKGTKVRGQGAAIRGTKFKGIF